jgi:hypothetical protein
LASFKEAEKALNSILLHSKSQSGLWHFNAWRGRRWCHVGSLELFIVSSGKNGCVTIAGSHSN